MASVVLGRAQRLFWDLHSRTWDDLVDVPAIAEHRAQVLAWLIDSLPPGEGPVLDLGCATGEMAMGLVDAGVSVVGLDLSPAMVARARAKAAGNNTRARFDVADLAQPLPLPAASCRAVMCVYVLQLVPQPAALLAEIRRVLRPDGVALFDVPLRGHDRRPPPGPLLHRPFWLGKRALVRAAQATLRYDPERLVTAIADAGLTVRERRAFPETVGILAAQPSMTRDTGEHVR